MRKYLLSLCLMAALGVNASEGTFGGVTLANGGDDAQLATVAAPGDLAAFLSDGNNASWFCGNVSRNKLVISGPLNEDDIVALQNTEFLHGKGILSEVDVLDFTNVTTEVTPLFENTSAKFVIWPKTVDPTDEQKQTIYTKTNLQIDNQANAVRYGYYYDKNGNNLYCPSYITDGNFTKISAWMKDLIDDDLLNINGFHIDYVVKDATKNEAQNKYDYYTTFSSTFISELGQLPIPLIDFTGSNISAAGYNFAGLNAETHYLIVSQNSTSYDEGRDLSYIFDTTKSSYTLPSTIWTVSNYYGTAEGESMAYGNSGCYAGTVNSFNRQNRFETNFVTCVRNAGVLDGAMECFDNRLKTTDVWTLLGNLNGDDIAALNDNTTAGYCGPKSSELDLSNTTVSDADLSTLANSSVKLLPLPYNCALDVKTAFKTNCANLKALATYNLTTHSIYMHSYESNNQFKTMRCLLYATNSESNNIPVNSIYNIYASGYMCARDMSASTGNENIDDRGHFVLDYQETTYTTFSNHQVAVTNAVKNPEQSASYDKTPSGSFYWGALAGKVALNENLNIVDFGGVILPSEEANPNSVAKQYSDGTYQDDINFAQNGLVCARGAIILPTSETYWRIGCNALSGGANWFLSEICIPGQIKEIGSYAFGNDNLLTHITTTNGVGEEYSCDTESEFAATSFTLPPSLELIESGAFSQVQGVTDVYVTSPTVPVCQMDAFDWISYVGYGGSNDLSSAYTTGEANRETYHMTAQERHTFAVLHWTEEFELDDIKKFTDIERVYSLKDNTGLTDSFDNPIYWPTQAEYNRGFALAINNYLEGAWDKDWTVPNVNQTDADQYYEDNGSPAGETYSDYVGWHQFILVASYSLGEKYVEFPWYSICLPYDMTLAQIKAIYGVPAPGARTTVDDKGATITIGGTNQVTVVTQEGEVIGNVVQGDESEAYQPDLRPLSDVRRELLTNSKGAEYGQITLCFPYNLVKRKTVFIEGQGLETEDEAGTRGENDVIMQAGYPYIIKGYVPQGEQKRFRQYGIEKVLEMSGPGGNPTLATACAAARAANPYDQNLQKATDEELLEWHKNNWIDLTLYGYDPNAVSAGPEPVAAPYEWHVTVSSDNSAMTRLAEQYAAGDYDDIEEPEIIVEKDADGHAIMPDYIYRFVGSFDNPYGENGTVTKAVPMWSYFLYSTDENNVNNQWYKYVDSWGDWTSAWVQYGALIGRVINKGTANEVFPFKDLIYDYDKGNKTVLNTNIGMSFEEGETTIIKGIASDGRLIFAPSGNVYNVSGQLVRTDGSLEGLAKGIYVINGKKYVVK